MRGRKKHGLQRLEKAQIVFLANLMRFIESNLAWSQRYFL